ncbi:oligosaccharide flippase family protein, partial [Vibrio tarriae]|uniref:oligosaccharide flippase family protein n=1 Tax=Vibrio tarriae TaxID=2014742 RepID=UPI0015EEC491
MKNNLIKKIIFSGLGNALNKGFIYLSTVLYSFNLSKDLFSEFSLVITTITMVGGLSTIGTSMVITNNVSKNNFNKSVIKKLLTIIPLAALILTIFVLPYVVRNATFIDAIKLPIIILSCSILVAIDGLLMAILAGKLKYEVIAVGNLLKSIPLMCSVLFFTTKFGYLAFFFGFIVSLIVGIVFMSNEVVKDLNGNDYRVKTSEILAQSIPLFISDIIVLGSIWTLGVYLAEKFTLIELGIFNLVNQINIIFAFITTSLLSPILPYVNKIRADTREKIYTYTPCYIFGFLALIFSNTYIYQQFVGNGLLVGQEESIKNVLAITLISVFKMSLIRRSVQAGKTVVSLISNIFWGLSTVVIFYAKDINSVSSVFDVLFLSHLITLFFTLFLYCKSKI